MNAVIISFDSLATNSIGCYGNEWVETPHFDRFAANGAIFDRHFVDTIDIRAGLAWSNGQHALSPPDLSRSSLGSLLKSCDVETRMIAAGPVRDWQRSADFVNLGQVEGNDGPGAKPDEGSFAQVVKAGISALDDFPEGDTHRLLWLHSPGPGVPPEGFDELYFEDFEERGQNLAELSDDALAQHPAIYAGAVSLLDYWLGEFLAHLEKKRTSQPLMVIVTAMRGSMWQNIKPSHSDSPNRLQSILGDQIARTPLLLQVQGDERFSEIVSLRSERLVQTCDIVPTLLDWFGTTATSGQHDVLGRSLLRELTEEVPARSFVWFGNGHLNDAIRTADWLCIRDNSKETDSDFPTSDRTLMADLFIKPEDIWDVSNVASQQPEVISQLMSLVPGQR